MLNVLRVSLSSKPPHQLRTFEPSQHFRSPDFRLLLPTEQISISGMPQSRQLEHARAWAIVASVQRTNSQVHREPQLIGTQPPYTLSISPVPRRTSWTCSVHIIHFHATYHLNPGSLIVLEMPFGAPIVSCMRSSRSDLLNRLTPAASS